MKPSVETFLKNFPFDFRDNQRQVLSDIGKALVDPKIKYVIVQAPTGCHAKGQGILMYDGSIKKVENIKIGDQLMGPDSKPRNVLELYRGRQKMAKIIPNKGEPFVVNLDHILSLKSTRQRANYSKKRGIQSTQNKITNISVKDYLKKSNHFKHIHKLYRVGVDFTNNTLSNLNSYFLGLWLGDGDSDCARLTTMDNEIKTFLKSLSKEYGVTYKESLKKDTKAVKISLTTERGKENKLLKLIQNLNLINNKHIPQIYKTSSRGSRLELLAGLIDSDGNYSRGCFEITQKNKRLADDILFLSRSLGFASYIKSSFKKCQTGNGGKYYRIIISGNLEKIPTKISRKQASTRGQKKNVLSIGFKIELLGEDDYYGFELDKDHLYLLDDFTITHNTGKSPLAMAAAKSYPKSYVITSNKFLQDQYLRDFEKTVTDLRGRSNYRCDVFSGTNGVEFNCGNSLCRNSKAGKSDCAKRAACEYHKQLFDAKSAPITSMNFAAFLSFANFTPHFPARDLLIIDEGHLIEDQMTSFVGQVISTWHKDRKYFEDEIPNYKNPEDYIEFLRSIVKYGDDILNSDDDLGKPSEDLENFVRETKRLITELDTYPDNFILQKDYEDPDTKYHVKALRFQPIDVAEFSNNFLFKHADKVLIMSATIVYETVVRTLGIPKEKSVFIDCPSSFPVENRKILDRSVGPVTNKTKKKLLPEIVKEINRILDEHKNDKGIIFTPSYEFTKYIVDNISPKSRSRIIYPQRSFQQKEAVERHASDPRPTVLISPSMNEGVDLKGDLSRFQILTKVPFPNLGDKLVEKRLYSRKKFNWYPLVTLAKVMQAYGRSVRSKEDHAITYVLDEKLYDLMNQYWELLPSYFVEAFEQEDVYDEG